MGFYQIRREVQLAADIETVWDFISNPANLKKITPDYMMFDITSSDIPDTIYEGMIITYIVSPIAGIKTRWVTEITHIKEKEYFVDEQRVGPYKIWHHQHFLSKTEKGTLMHDIVSYKPPFGFFGEIANTLLIKKRLNHIFEFRAKALDNIFGTI